MKKFLTLYFVLVALMNVDAHRQMHEEGQKFLIRDMVVITVFSPILLPFWICSRCIDLMSKDI
jgi:hypothetical protein